MLYDELATQLFGARYMLLLRFLVTLVIALSVGLAVLADHVETLSKNESTHTALPNIESDDWKSLFNGTDLTGWVRRNGTATFEVVEQTITGTTAVGSPNSFLCTESEFSDFELTFEVQLDSSLNSGVQIRSTSKKEINNGRVFGPQVEIECSSLDPSNPCEAGYIYSEGTGRGWISQNRAIDDVFKAKEWNRYIVRASGPRIQTWINGQKIEDLLDEHTPMTGFIGLQVHSIPKDSDPLQVRWRDIRIRELQSDRPRD